MLAYYVHDPKKRKDIIVLPEMGCAVPVTPERLEAFISPAPVFAQWSGDSCGRISPEQFGTVVATREDGGDVCILKEDLWRERMSFYMTGGAS
jgi:hypothetical protein